MKIRRIHDWDLDYGAARALQDELAGRLVREPLPGGVRLVAGADMAFSRRAGLFFAAVIVIDTQNMETVEVRHAVRESTFPYIPGLLSFREGPVVLDAFAQVENTPDAVIFDGQGIAHPRRLGLAAHVGLWLGVPTVGCAKSRLIGEHGEPGRRKGSRAELRDGDERIGVVLRTRTDVKPVFVSPGHRADIETSAELVLRCCTRYRLPEPTRRAHNEVGRLKRDYMERAGR